jgi:tripartite-type tricarboxylate transporter receptor subunit TctC
VPLRHIPYKSGSQALTDVIAGVVPVMIWQVSPLKPHIASGAVKPIAALSAARIASHPDVPTLVETLLPGFDSNA